MTEVEPRPRITRSRLAALRLAELRDLASTLGIGNIASMRKGTLVDAINERYDSDDQQQDGAQPPVQVEDQQPADDAAAEQAPERSAPQAEADAPADGQQGGDDVVTPAEALVEPSAESPLDPAAPVEQAAPEAPAAPVEQAASEEQAGNGEAPAEQPAEAQQAVGDEPAAEQQPAEDVQPQADVAEAAEPQHESAAPSPDEAAGGAEVSDAAAEAAGTAEPKSAGSHVNAGLTGIAEDLQELQRREAGEGDDADAESEPEGERQGGRRGRGRGRGRQAQGEQQGQQRGQAQQNGQAAPAGQGQQNGQAAKAEPQQEQPKADQQGQQGQQDGEGRRGRYRDRKRRGAGGEWDEPEVRDDDVLIPIAGILDVLENYAFVRTSGYLSGANDVYVSLGQVKKYHLRRGDAVVGSIRQVPENEQPTRQKYNALVKVDSINGLPVAEAEERVEFEQLTPLYPQERLRLETESAKTSTRVVDLVAPIGKGQRGLIVAPPRAGRTLLLQALANAISKNNPEVHLMVVLVDERPEDVTEMQRSVKGEVIASTFDRAPEDHTTVAELAIERAERLVELGYDVVVLIDSLTRLARAYAQTVPAAGRALGGGLDAAALLPAKRLFGAARNIENGGSLTVLGTALIETAEADAVVLQELRGAANAELVLSSALAEKRIFPAIDVSASGTVRDEHLLGPDEVKVVRQLRRALAGRSPQEALETVVGKLRETGTNVEFLVQMQKSLPSGK